MAVGRLRLLEPAFIFHRANWSLVDIRVAP
jgi:hypothetical protein